MISIKGSALARAVLLGAPRAEWRLRDLQPVVLRFLSLSRAPRRLARD